MKKSVVGRFGCYLCFFCFLIVACDWIESSESAYADYDDAIKAGAIGVGNWLPDFLPKSAKDIREKHNLDTNEQWVRFHFASSELGEFTRSCRRMTRGSVRLPRRDADSWWSNRLRRDALELQSGDDVYMYMACGEATYLAIHVYDSVAFFWSIAR